MYRPKDVGTLKGPVDHREHEFLDGGSRFSFAFAEFRYRFYRMLIVG
jgi:hypothetical protein